MIPIRDTIPSKTYPVVNTAIIGLNVLVYFLMQPAGGPPLERFAYLYGLVPARYTVAHISDYFSVGQQLFSFLSFMFLHGGVWHLLGNMWSLFIFGDNIEDRLGPVRYLLFYLLCGLASGMTHFIFNPGSNVPTIGASGAIAGVMGAYIVLYPGARILTLIPIIFIPWFVEIPAFFFLGIWFVMQFINATVSSGVGGGVAWWAHVGGFVSGILLLGMLIKIPISGLGNTFRRAAQRKTSNRLQVVRTTGEDAANQYGTLTITHYEGMVGTSKVINVPHGFNKRLFRITVPPGTRDGSVLRLRGLGRHMAGGKRGDLYLKVVVPPVYKTDSL